MPNIHWATRVGQIGLLGSNLLFATPATARAAEESSRPVSAAELTEKLVASAARGNLDDVRKLADQGASIRKAGKRGLTPWQAARIHGRRDVADFLAGKGAATRLPAKAERVVDATLKAIVQDGGSGVAVLIAKG